MRFCFRLNKKESVENYALKLSLEFGRNFGQDISERLVKRFPNLSETEISNVKKLVQSVESDCWNIVNPEVLNLTPTDLTHLLNNKIFAKYGWISSANKNRINTVFSYYFWKEGYLN